MSAARNDTAAEAYCTPRKPSSTPCRMATVTAGRAAAGTPAGTVPPARVFVVGAGVAGLQAIATARRLGAIVSATDVRPAAKDEIRSLGATFVGVEDEETAKQTGAYAKEMSDDFRRKQAELMATTSSFSPMRYGSLT